MSTQLPLIFTSPDEVASDLAIIRVSAIDVCNTAHDLAYRECRGRQRERVLRETSLRRQRILDAIRRLNRGYVRFRD